MVCTNKVKFDVVVKLEEYLDNAHFSDIMRSMVHARFLKILDEHKGEAVPDEMLEHIYTETLAYFYATSESDEDYVRDSTAFDAEVWPVLRERLRKNMGTAQFMLEYGVHSRYIATCILDMADHPAMLILMGHGIGHTVTGGLEAIPKYDAAMRFMKDPSFSLFRFRNKKSAQFLKKSRKVLMLGGGAAVSLLMRGYPLGELDQEIVIYDTDLMMKQFLELIVGRPLKLFGIDYRVADFREAFSDPKQKEYYTYVEGLGVPAYYAERPEELFGGIHRVLAPGGMTVFDNQVMSVPTLPFDALIMMWKIKQGDCVMRTEKSVKDAIDVATVNCKNNGLSLVQYFVEDITDPAGVVFLATKAS